MSKAPKKWPWKRVKSPNGSFLSLSFVDLPNLSSSIYSTELCNRLRAFLTSCPPTGPSTPVAELVIATADFQRDLASWKIWWFISPVSFPFIFHSWTLSDQFCLLFVWVFQFCERWSWCQRIVPPVYLGVDSRQAPLPSWNM